MIAGESSRSDSIAYFKVRRTCSGIGLAELKREEPLYIYHAFKRCRVSENTSAVRFLKFLSSYCFFIGKHAPSQSCSPANWQVRTTHLSQVTHCLPFSQYLPNLPLDSFHCRSSPLHSFLRSGGLETTPLGTLSDLTGSLNTATSLQTINSNASLSLVIFTPWRALQMPTLWSGWEI
jgi:hypothetical protein